VIDGADTVATLFTTAAGGSGVEEDAGGNRYWTIDATSVGAFVAEGTIPPEVTTGLPSSGPLSDFLAQPVNLSAPGSLVCVDVRTVSDARPASARIVLGDADGNFAAGAASLTLTQDFATHELDPLTLLGDAIDLTRIETIGVEFSVASAGANEDFSFDVDEVRLIPEPGVWLQAIAALCAIAALRRRRG
jgi:hypothetical protein